MPPPALESVTTDGEVLLTVEDLHAHFFTEHGELPAVDGVSFSIQRGRTLALVGESGCGKSVTAHAILRLIPPPGRIVRGRMILYSRRAGTIDIATLEEGDDPLYQVRGGLVSMIFQEPMTALSPVHTVGSQISESHPVAPEGHGRGSPAPRHRHAAEGGHGGTGTSL